MIRLLCMDVDGTLTDGKIYMGPDGEAMKSFDVKDGYAIANMLPSMNIVPVIITGRRSGIVARRAEELGIKVLHQGVSDKLGCLQAILHRCDLTPQEAAYIGDDLNDMDCIVFSGFSACPSDAVVEVKAAVDYVCTSAAGDGAVREFVEVILEKNREA